MVAEGFILRIQDCLRMFILYKWPQLDPIGKADSRWRSIEIDLHSPVKANGRIACILMNRPSVVIMAVNGAVNKDSNAGLRQRDLLAGSGFDHLQERCSNSQPFAAGVNITIRAKF